MGSSLHRDIGEEDFLNVDVRVFLDRLQDPLLDLVAALALDQLVVGRVGELARDQVTDDRLLRFGPVAPRGGGGAVPAAVTAAARGRLDHERDLELGEAAVGQIDQELLVEDVDLAVDLGLRGLLLRLGEDGLVGAAGDDERRHDDDDELLVHLSPPCDGVAPCRRVRMISTLRFCARPAGVALPATGCCAAYPASDIRLPFTPAPLSRCTTAASAFSSSDGFMAFWFACVGVSDSGGGSGAGFSASEVEPVFIIAWPPLSTGPEKASWSDCSSSLTLLTLVDAIANRTTNTANSSVIMS